MLAGGCGDAGLAIAGNVYGSMDIWVLEDYNDDRSWRKRHLRVDLPTWPFVLSQDETWPLLDVSWAMNTGVDGHGDLILLGSTSEVGLYHLTEMRMLDRFKLLESSLGNSWDTPSTRRKRLVFTESLVRHAFFNLH